jgi:DNA phosphorothioation-associated putative methyltransferase
MLDVLRHKTAISRYGLSAPLQALARHGLLNEECTFFDYGCGQGDDVAALRGAGVSASGWDPHYFPDAEQKPADIVNLGFVLNVIEKPEERRETAQKAFALTRKCLVIAVMLQGQAQRQRLTRYNDGFLTQRNTFQKYFNQTEIKNLVEDALKQEAIALAPGVFVVFRDKIAEQQFLSNRHRRARDISHLLSLLDRPSGKNQEKDALLLKEHSELITSIWAEMLRLGRLPDPNELDPDIYKKVADRLGSLRTVARLAESSFGTDALKEARVSRIDDLKVYFSLNLFSRRKPYHILPVELQRDIKAFFGNYKNADSAGRETLFSVGDPSTIVSACEQASKSGVGFLDGHSLQLDTRLVERLPAALRVYIGCAEVLYGDIDDANLVKIHLQSGKLTLLKYEDYQTSPLPKLKQRIKVRLRHQDIEFFDYGGEYPSQFLYLKSRFMSPDQNDYQRQKNFDDALAKIPTIDLSEYGPTIEEFQRLLFNTKRQIRGFEIVQSCA